MAAARASGLGNRSPLGLSPLLHGERWRELDPASRSGQVHGIKTCIEQSCKPEVARSLAYHLSNLTSLHGFSCSQWESKEVERPRGMGLACVFVLETATKLPAQKALLRQWWKNHLL